jgi:hypothetical protein
MKWSSKSFLSPLLEASKKHQSLFTFLWWKERAWITSVYRCHGDESRNTHCQTISIFLVMVFPISSVVVLVCLSFFFLKLFTKKRQKFERSC